MSDIGIFLPTISGIGGVERIAHILARDIGVDIYTAAVRDDINLYFPEMSEHIINISKNPDKTSLMSIIRDFKSLQTDVNLMVYLYPRSIYLSVIKKDVPYLYYLGGIPHHFYLTAHEYEQHLGRLSFKDYVDRVIWKEFTKRLDSQRVIANSKMIANTYQNIVGVEPKDVLYPPIDTNQYKAKHSENYYLSVSRFESYKRIDWQIEAFRNTNENLVIVGNGPLYDVYFRYINEHQIDNITIVSAVGQDELIEYYSKCKAFIFTSYKEHFGMTPLEAMASGKPVFSIREGGPLEYVVEGVNGFYFDTISELRRKIGTISDEELKNMQHACITTANQFDTSTFIKKFSELVKGTC